MTYKAGIKQCNIDTCLIYRVNKLGTTIIIVYVYYRLELRDKLLLTDRL